jgi:ornithine cyclodeaminase/alanine dehydrogenase-like protein (mu-crystallin family)
LTFAGWHGEDGLEATIVALLLRDKDVAEMLTMDSMIEAIETMLRHHGAGQSYNLPRQRIMAPGGELAVLGGGLFHDNVFGVKIYTVVNGGYSFHVLLYDASTGQLLALLQANRLGQLRTGATTGVAAKYLARKSSQVVGIIGSGFQAPTQLEAICSVRKITKAKVYSPNPRHRREFARTAASKLGIEVVPTDTNRETVEKSDVVVCIAANETPVVEGSWLSPGTLVVGAGPATWRAQELDEAAIKGASRIFVDSLAQAPYEAGDLARAVDKGLLRWDQMWELRHVVAGVVPGRRRDDETIYVKLMGTGIADVAAAKLAYDTAKVKGLGTEVDI